MTRLLRSARTHLCCLALLFFASAAFGQGAGGTITGTVTDETGATLPGAAVTIRNEDTGTIRELVTGEGGRFRAPDLAPGPYAVTAALSGFGAVARRGITLTVGREAVVDFMLKVGQLTDVVNVVGETSTVDTRTSSTGGLISEEQIKNLPLNGRSFIELASSVPGRAAHESGWPITSTGFGQKISVNGSRYTQNLFTLDGTMMNDQFNQAGSASGNMLGVEAVREFQVLTNSFSAEYGRHTGGGHQRGDQDRHQRVPWFRFRVPPQRGARREAVGSEAEQPRQAGFHAQPVRVLRWRADHPERTFFFATYEGLRGAARDRPPRSRSRLRRYGRRRRLRCDPSSNRIRRRTGRVLDAQRARVRPAGTRDTDEHYAMGRIDHQFTDEQQDLRALHVQRRGSHQPEPRDDRRDHQDAVAVSSPASTRSSAAPGSSTGCRSGTPAAGSTASTSSSMA